MSSADLKTCELCNRTLHWTRIYGCVCDECIAFGPPVSDADPLDELLEESPPSREASEWVARTVAKAMKGAA